MAKTNETTPGQKSIRGEYSCAAGTPSLVESFRSVGVPVNGKFIHRFFAFLGPGFLVSVGYMDPGNWATSIAGGSEFGYTLLAAVLVSSLMAIILQALCARFAIVTGRDLAQACREKYSPKTSFVLWVLAELAIIATDLAEVIGTAIGLQLLFGLPLIWGVAITALDVFLILWLQSKGFRYLEAFIVTMIIVIAGSFVGQLFLSQPSITGIISGFLPAPEIVTDQRMLYLALGIIGATVMPHNLYLHTGIVQTRAYTLDERGKREAIKFATIDSTFALSFALLVNASILILAASAFYDTGQGPVEDLRDAHALLAPLLGAAVAPILFAVALLASGLAYRHRNPGRTDRHGGVFAHQTAALHAPFADQGNGDCARYRHDHDLWRTRGGPAPGSQPGCVVAATAVCGRAPDHVFHGQKKNGRVSRAHVGPCFSYRCCGAGYCAQYQADF